MSLFMAGHTYLLGCSEGDILQVFARSNILFYILLLLSSDLDLVESKI